MTAIIEEFEYLDYTKDRYFRRQANNNRKEFVNNFPIEKIPDLSLQDYLIGKKGIGNEQSFCRKMRYNLSDSASLGNVRFDIFGIYYDSNGNVALSKTFRNMFGDDISSAFDYIKKEIIAVLNAAEDEDYPRIVSSKLNSSFMYKLITVYYPNKYIPVVTNRVLNEYCKHVGLSINPNEPMIYRNIALRDWKDHNDEACDWSNIKLMRFCDWLWRSNRYLNQDAANADRR